MKKKALLLTIILCILLIGCKEKKHEVSINVKTSLYTLNNPLDPEISVVYDFLKKASEAFIAQYTKADVHINLFQYEVMRRTIEVEESFGTETATDMLWTDMGYYTYSPKSVALDDIITPEIRSDIDEQYWQNCSIHGEVHMMPFGNAQMVLCYNKKLFHEVGLDQYISDKDEIQRWSLDDFNKILAILHEKLPDYAYPMMMYAATPEGDMHLMTLFRSHGSLFYDQNNRFNVESPETLSAMQWIRDCNEKGYFPPNADRLVMLDCYDLFINNQLAIYCANRSIERLYINRHIDYGLVDFPSKDGKGLNTSSNLGFFIFDNGDPEKIQVAKDFLKFLYSTDWLDYSICMLPVSHRVSQKYSHFKEVQKYLNNNDTNNNYTKNHPNWNGVRKVFHKHIQDLLYGEKSILEIAQEIDRDCNAAIEAGYKELEN